MKLIVGLGNPGDKYSETRHNLGFRVIDRIAVKAGVSVQRVLCSAIVGEGALDGVKVVLAKPQTYMNRSGLAVADLALEYGIGPDALVVINDDLDLAFGRIRIRQNGGAGGHRGLVSILESVAGAPFDRVRVGIGRPPDGMNSADFVLAPFSDREKEQLAEVIDRAAESVICLVYQGRARAMAEYNRAN